jgi:hypothetical protein
MTGALDPHRTSMKQRNRQHPCSPPSRRPLLFGVRQSSDVAVAARVGSARRHNNSSRRLRKQWAAAVRRCTCRPNCKAPGRWSRSARTGPHLHALPAAVMQPSRRDNYRMIPLRQFPPERCTAQHSQQTRSDPCADSATAAAGATGEYRAARSDSRLSSCPLPVHVRHFLLSLVRPALSVPLCLWLRAFSKQLHTSKTCSQGQNKHNCTDDCVILVRPRSNPLGWFFVLLWFRCFFASGADVFKRLCGGQQRAAATQRSWVWDGRQGTERRRKQR